MTRRLSHNSVRAAAGRLRPRGARRERQQWARTTTLGAALSFVPAAAESREPVRPVAPLCECFDAHAPRASALPRAVARATGHLNLSTPCAVARFDAWNEGPTGVTAQLVWRGADAHGEFSGASVAAPFRVRAMTADGQFVPGAVHTLRAVTREGAWIERCAGDCEMLFAAPGGALVSLALQ